VERAAGIDCDGERADLSVLAPAGREEVAHWHFDRRRRLTVPVDAQDREAPVAGGRHPDVLDGARAGDVSQRERLAGFDLDRRRDLPALAEVVRGARAGALGRLAAAALRAGEVLGADRSRLRA